jgi:hypothetical protein
MNIGTIGSEQIYRELDEMYEEFDKKWKPLKVKLSDNHHSTLDDMAKFGMFLSTERLVQVLLNNACRFWNKHGHLKMFNDDNL